MQNGDDVLINNFRANLDALSLRVAALERMMTLIQVTLEVILERLPPGDETQ